MESEGKTTPPRAPWAVLWLLTAINIGAALVTVYVAAQARADFRAAAAPIAQMGAAILGSLRDIQEAGK